MNERTLNSQGKQPYRNLSGECTKRESREMTERTREPGFTLIELMIVIAIIVVLVAIAVPSLLRSRLQTNEATAVENLRTVGEAEIGYNASHHTFGDFAALTEDPGGTGSAFLDDTWTQGVVRNGYAFTVDSADDANFVCYADPVDPGTTGVRYFRIDGSGIIRWNRTERPSATDPAIGSDV